MADRPIVSTQMLVEHADALAPAVLAAPKTNDSVVVQINGALSDDVCQEYNC